MAAALAEQVAEQIGRAVDDLRHVFIIRRAVDEAADPHAGDDAIERAAASLTQDREEIERADARRLDAGGEIVVDADLAMIGNSTVPLADLPGKEDGVAVAAKWNEIGDRHRNPRQGESELDYPAFGGRFCGGKRHDSQGPVALVNGLRATARRQRAASSADWIAADCVTKPNSSFTL